MLEIKDPIDSYFNDLNDFESENPDLVSKKFKGIEIYPVVKLTQMFFVVRKDSSSGLSISKKSKLFSLRTCFLFLIKYCFYYLKYPLRNTKVDTIIFTANLNKRFTINDTYSDAFFDSIRDYLKAKSVVFETFERIKNYEFRFPGFHNSSLFEHLLWFSKIKSKLDWKNSGALKMDVRHLLVSLNHKLNGRIIFNEKKAIEDILYIMHLSKLFEKHLKKKKPKCIILIPYYGYVGLALTNAAKRLNISVVDIQHGVQGDYHIAYGSWKYAPIDGWNSLPDYFLVWSGTEKGALNSLYINSKGSHTAIVCGNILLIDYLTRKNYYDQLSLLIKEFVTEKSFKDIGLITLQDKANLNGIFLKTIEKTKETVFWIIRPHHSNTRPEIDALIEKLDKHKCKNFDILFSSSFPLYSILQVTSFHMTGYSSAVIEANYFNIPSIINNELGKFLYKDLIEKGVVFFADQDSTAVSLLYKELHSDYKEKTFNTIEMNQENLSIESYGNVILKLIK